MSWSWDSSSNSQNYVLECMANINGIGRKANNSSTWNEIGYKLHLFCCESCPKSEKIWIPEYRMNNIIDYYYYSLSENASRCFGLIIIHNQICVKGNRCCHRLHVASKQSFHKHLPLRLSWISNVMSEQQSGENSFHQWMWTVLLICRIIGTRNCALCSQSRKTDESMRTIRDDNNSNCEVYTNRTYHFYIMYYFICMKVVRT